MSISAHRAEFFAFVEHTRVYVGKEILIGWLQELLDSVRLGEAVSPQKEVNNLTRSIALSPVRIPTEPLPLSTSATTTTASVATAPIPSLPLAVPMRSPTPGLGAMPRSHSAASRAATPREVRQRPTHHIRVPTQTRPTAQRSEPPHFTHLASWYRVWHDKIAAGTRLLCSTTPTWTVRLSLLLEIQDMLDQGLVRLQSQTMSTSEPIYNSFKRLLPLVAIQLQDTQHTQVIGAAAQVLSRCATVLGPFLVAFFPTVMTLLPGLGAQMSHTAIMAIIKATQCHTIMQYLTNHNYQRLYGDYYLAVLCIVVENLHRVITVSNSVGNSIHTLRLVNGQPLAALQQCFPNCSFAPLPLPHFEPHPLDPYYDCLSDYVQNYLEQQEETNIGVLMFWPFYICAPQIATVLFNSATPEVRLLCANIPDNWAFVIHTGILLANGGKEIPLTRGILASSLVTTGGTVARPNLHPQDFPSPQRAELSRQQVTPPRSTKENLPHHSSQFPQTNASLREPSSYSCSSVGGHGSGMGGSWVWRQLK